MKNVFRQFFLTTCAVVTMLAAASVRADGNRGHSYLDHREFRDSGPTAVYTMDNAATGNNVWAFQRSPKGALAGPFTYPTGGTGTSDGLGNQGGIQLSRDGRWLLVCNAGSDDISVFAVTRRGLLLTDRTASEGHRPISLALHGNLLYVLNAGGALPGGSDSIAGFLFVHGKLLHLPGASYALSADNTAPAEVAFTRDGEHLVVTEKATGLLDSFQVGADGLVNDSKTFPSPTPTPFGFAAGRQNHIFVTEANGGAATPGGGSVSSYEVTDDGDLEIISASVPTHQTAACWLVLSHDERFAYTANTPDNSISSFFVRRNGSLNLLRSQAASTGAGSNPVDMYLSHDGRYLFTLNSGNGTIGAFQIRSRTGALAPLPGAANLPATVNGLAVY